MATTRKETRKFKKRPGEYSLRDRSSRAKPKVQDKADRQKAEAEEVLDDWEGDREDFDLPNEHFANSLWKSVDERMKARKGAFHATGVGGPRAVSGPEELWELCKEYFLWAEQNPLREAKVFSTKDGIKKTSIPKMRVFTNTGLCAFLGVARNTWVRWRSHPDNADIHEVICLVDQIIREQKFSGAAVDLLNANLMARDLGIADKQELSGPDGGPVEISARELLLERLSRLSEASEPKDPPSKG